MVTVKFKPKPKPDFDYTDVPYSGRDTSNRFVKTNPYWTKDTSGNNVKFFRDEPKYNRGQDFYRDRIFRDEMQARRNFFNSPNFQGSYQAEILNSLSGRAKESKKQQFIKDVTDYQLRTNPPIITGYTEARPPERPGGIMNYHPVMMNYAAGLAEARQNLFNERYNPYYGLTDAKYNEIIEGQEEPTSWMHGLKYGDEEPKTGLDFWIDYGKEASRTALNDVAWLQDAATKGVSQTFWPWDKETMTGGVLPRGWKDLAEYTSLMGEFDALGLGVTEEQWNNLGYSERFDLNKQFKELTGSPWEYDPTYHPLTEDGGFKSWAKEFSDEYLTPSSDYLDSEYTYDLPNPLAFRTAEDKDFTYSPMNSAELTGSLLSGAGLIALARKLGNKIAPFIPAILKNYPKSSAVVGGTGAYTAGEYFED